MLIALRDLQHRRRRFAISIVVVGVVFGLALALSGLSAGFANEARRVVNSFDADAWVLPVGAAGPFNSSELVPASLASELAAVPGVTAVRPMLVGSGTVGDTSVSLVGLVEGEFTAKLRSGRLPAAPLEVVADVASGKKVGDRIELGGSTWTVVGTTSGMRLFAGVPVVFARLADVAAVQLNGLDVVSAFIVDGVPTGPLPDGLQALDQQAVLDSLLKPLASARSTIDGVRILLWLVSAGIIGSIMYLTVLERLRDIAVLKAIGVSTRSVLGGLFLQAVVISLVSAVLAIVVGIGLAPVFPMAVEIPSSAVVAMPVVALVIAAIASLMGARRAVRVDPALAFGG